MGAKAGGRTIRPQRNTVVVRRDGQYVSVAPRVPGLASTFVGVRHVADPDSGRVLAVPYPLLWEMEGRSGPALQAFAGLEPLVVAWLRRSGYAVEMAGDRPPEWVVPDAGRLARVGGTIDHGLLEFVRRHDRGVIRYHPDHVDPDWLVAQIALGWPKERVLVTATRRETAADLHSRLRAYFPGAALFAGTSHRRAGRVTVATPAYARAGAIGIERRTVYVAADPADLFSATQTAGVDSLRAAWRARLYGLLPLQTELPPHTRSLMTSLFGPDEVVIPRHGHVERAVEVVFVTVEGGPRVRDADPVALRRGGVWQHPVRNRRLAKLARLLAAGDIEAVRAAFSHLSGVALGAPPGRRVVILADGVEHALALAGHVPDAPVVCGSDPWTAGLTAGQAERLDSGAGVSGTARLLIATQAGLSSACSFEILVRADAGRGLPPLPDDQLVAPHGSASSLLVVDCADRHHPALRVRSRERRAAYVVAGWIVAGEPTLSPLDRVLADRPEVRV
jgi:hypothetical protein